MKELNPHHSSPFKNRLLHWTFIIVLGGAVFVCAFFLYSRTSSKSNSVNTQPTTTKNKAVEARRELPAKLQIPSIEVDATVESVGITPQGAMDTPVEPLNVAWYNLGPRPGERGIAVIDGHLDGENQTEAVFKDLEEIAIGDTITVVDAKGAKLTFTVRATKLYDAQADTREVFINPNGYFLNLITCAGEWNEERKDYEERFVVFSELTSVE